MSRHPRPPPHCTRLFHDIHRAEGPRDITHPRADIPTTCFSIMLLGSRPKWRKRYISTPLFLPSSILSFSKQVMNNIVNLRREDGGNNHTLSAKVSKGVREGYVLSSVWNYKRKRRINYRNNVGPCRMYSLLTSIVYRREKRVNRILPIFTGSSFL